MVDAAPLWYTVTLTLAYSATRVKSVVAVLFEVVSSVLIMKKKSNLPKYETIF